MKLTIDQEIELIEKYKADLICPNCQEELMNKDYKKNGILFKGLWIGLIIGTLGTLLIKFALSLEF